VSRSAATAALFLQFSLIDVATPAHQFVSDPLLNVASVGVVPTVELLDDLESPTTVEDIAADEPGPDVVGEFGATRVFEKVRGIASQEVGAADQLMHAVEVATRPFDPLERFADLPGRLHADVVGAIGPAMILIHELISLRVARPLRTSHRVASHALVIPPLYPARCIPLGGSQNTRDGPGAPASSCLGLSPRGSVGECGAPLGEPAGAVPVPNRFSKRLGVRVARSKGGKGSGARRIALVTRWAARRANSLASARRRGPFVG
jgi:hypothetical protein